MAKNQNGLAEGVQANESGGWPGGFLAEEEGFDRRALWRLGFWGVGSVGAVIVALLAYNSGAGIRPHQVVAADLAKQSPHLEIAEAAKKEIRRLSSAIDTLNGDRDRLFARIAALEQGFESVTGSNSRKAARGTDAVTTTTSMPPVIEPDPARQPDSSGLDASTTRNASTDAPLSAPVAFTTAAAVKPLVVTSSPADASSRSANIQPTPTPTAGSWFTPTTHGKEASAAVATPIAPEAAAQPAPAAHDPPATLPRGQDQTATRGIESESERNLHHKEAQIVAASIPPIADAVQPPSYPSPVPAPRTDFGVDLGSASSIKGLRALWQGLLKLEAKELTPMHPIIVLKETNNGSGTQMRLVAGPLADAAAAARICAVLSENGRNCDTAVFDGQRLLEDSKDSDIALATRRPKAAHASRHRHGRKSTSVEAPAPPPPSPLPPKPSTLGSSVSH